MKKIFSLTTPRVWWVLTVLGVLIYSNTFKSAFVCDDPIVISQNPAIRHLDLWNLWQAFNTRFVVGLSLALNYWLGKENVVGYHLFNLVVHILNSFLVYRLVCLTFSTPRMSKSSLDPKLIGFLTALVFLTHPLQTQGVTYIWQRATSLAALFYIGALVFYIKSRLKPSGIHYALCLLLTVWGMFTKEIVFTLPFAILLYEFIFLKELSSPRRRGSRLDLIPAFAGMTLLATLFIIPWGLTQTNEHTLGLLRPKNTSMRHQGNFIKGIFEMTRAVSDDKVSRKDFILTELNVLRTYLRLFILPVRQSVDYDYPRAGSLLETETLLSFLLLLSLLGLGFILLKKHPLLSFAIFWFFLTVSVEALVAQEEFILEHRMYLPMAGLAFGVVYLMGCLFKNKPRGLAVLLLGIVSAYSFLTFQRNFVWRDEFSLWDDAVKKAPHKARTYKNRGSASGQKGQFDKALADLDKAIELQPDYSSAYFVRGSVYQKKGLLDQALLDFNKAIELKPAFAEAYNNRAYLYFSRKEYDKSRQDMKKAQSLGLAVNSQ